MYKITFIPRDHNTTLGFNTSELVNPKIQFLERFGGCNI